MKFATFYYPGFYSCPARNAAAREVIDEWKLLKAPPPSVFVETHPIEPALGYTDCSDPGALAEEAHLAVRHGVDAFIFNYYNDGTREELAAPVTAFAALETELQFALNLCCHMPKRKLPFAVQDEGIAPLTQLTEEEFRALADDLAVRFVGHPRYLRHRGRVVVTMYHVNALVLLYGPGGLKSRLEILRSVLRGYGHEVHLIGLYSVAGGWSRRPPSIVELPFDSFSCYVALPDFESPDPVQAFRAAAERSLQAMQAKPSGETPVVACVGAGWNATARGAPGYNPLIHGLAFPYYPVVIGDDPDAFEQYLRRAARAALENPGFESGLFFLGPWNEWTEGCYLLPDTRHGVAKLEAVRRVKAELDATATGVCALAGARA